MTGRQPAGHPANSTRYKKARAAFMERQGAVGVCWLCGGAIDMSLSGRHRSGPTIDHVRPTSADPDDFLDETNWELAHRAAMPARAAEA